MRQETGFSVVELLVALTIFSFGVLATAALLGAGYRYEGRAQLDTQLTIMAESKLEELRALGGTDRADTVAISLGGDLATDVADHYDTATVDGRSFLRRWRVEPGPAGTRKITVGVYQVDPAGPVRTRLTNYVIHE